MQYNMVCLYVDAVNPACGLIQQVRSNPSTRVHARQCDKLVAIQLTARNTVIVGGDPKPRRKPASHGLMRVPRGPSNVPQSLTSGVQAIEITFKPAAIPVPDNPRVGDPCYAM
jgi:hypothetical protein